MWALSNIAGDSVKCRNEVIQAGAIDALAKYIPKVASLQMLQNASWCISNIMREKPLPECQHVEQV